MALRKELRDSGLADRAIIHGMEISLKARNLPKLFFVWALNIAVLWGVLTGVPDVSNMDSLPVRLSDAIADPTAGWPYAGLLTMVSIFNGMVPRSVKEHLVFWPARRPGSRAFSHFMLKDSTINRKAIKEHFGPLPSDPDEQNALWAGWLHEFENDARVRPAYGLYLFGRDWMTVAVTTLVLGSPIAVWFSTHMDRALYYAVVLVGQCALARWLGRVQGEQLVMSVMSCKGSSAAVRSHEEKRRNSS